MRRLLRRKAVTIIAAIVSVAAIPAAGIVATATPALASITLCERNNPNNQFCAGDPGALNNGDQVVLTVDGRQIDEVKQNFMCCGGYEVYRLHLDEHYSQCLGVASTFRVTLQDCSGGGDVNWAQKPQDLGGVKWFNNPTNEYLAGNGTLGDQLEVVPDPTGGWYLVWTL